MSDDGQRNDGQPEARKQGVSAAVKSKVALLLRRRIGSLREDKDFDAILRQKHVHILGFSMVGLGTMLLTAVITWFTSNAERPSNSPLPPTDSYYNDPNVSPTLLNLMYLSQAVITSSTVVCLVLITQKYRLLLMVKRAEWSGATVYEIETHRGDNVADTQRRDYFNKSYKFFGSSLMWNYIGEILIHVPHPIMWMASKPDINGDLDTIPNIGFKLLQIAMFLRLYLVPTILHLYSEPYINRFEVVSGDKDLLSVGYQINKPLTLKMLFYKYTAAVLVSVTLVSLIMFGYSIFSLERIEVIATRDDYNTFGSSSNAFWFSYVTFVTVGYGELAPRNVVGRVLAALCASVGVITFTIYGAVLVSRVSLTKEQKYGVEYLKTQKGKTDYIEAAEEVVKMALLTYMFPKIVAARAVRAGASGDEVKKIVDERQAPPARHKANRMYRAIKKFRAARRNLEAAFMQAEDVVVNQKMEAVEQMMLAIHREVNEHQAKFGHLERHFQQRFRSILNRVAMYRRQGNVPV